MLYRDIIAVFSEIHTKHINTLCGQNVELLNVKPGGTYSDHWAVNGKKFSSMAKISCLDCRSLCLYGFRGYFDSLSFFVTDSIDQSPS